MKYRFDRIKPTAEDWRKIESAYDSTCYQTEKWYAYLKRIGVKPFIVAVYEVKNEGVKELKSERMKERRTAQAPTGRGKAALVKS